MPEHPSNLTDVFFRLQGSLIRDYTFGQEVLRLVIQTAIAQYLSPAGNAINLVLEGCRELYYLSYTQTLDARTRQTQAEDIFEKALVIGGAENRSFNHFVIYCHSALPVVEAGELHITCKNFEMYDQEFGILNYKDFCQAFNKINKHS